MHALAMTVFVLISQANQPSAAPVLTLEEALRWAKQRNLDLQGAKARLVQAQEISKKAWAAYLPQLAVAGSYTRNSVAARISVPNAYYIRDVGTPTSPPANPADPNSPPGQPTTTILFPAQFESATIQPLNQLNAQAQLTQALIVPTLWPTIRNAYLAEKVAELNFENLRQETLFTVAQLYYSAAGLKQNTQVQERLLAVNRDHEKNARVNFDAGAVPKVSLLRAEIDRSRSEQDLNRAQIAFESAKTALATLLDRDRNFDVAIPTEPTLPAERDIETVALKERVDLKAARVSEEIADRTSASSWLKYLPSLTFQGSYRLSNAKGFTGTYYTWALGLGLNWTLFDGGLREAEVRENAAKFNEASAARRSAESKAKDELVRAQFDLESARSNRLKAREQAQLARETSAIVETNYREGAATYLEVADANASLLSAEIALVSETLNANLASLRVLKAAGQFNPGG